MSSNDPENWEFDVTTALHDDMKGGGSFPRKRVRVVMSREAFPRWEHAAETAGCIAVATNGGMPIAILPRY